MHHYTKKFFLVLMVVVTGSGIIAGLYFNAINQEQLQSNRYETTEINFQGESLNVLVADTDEKRIQGLSGRSELPAGIDGMLFMFEEPGMHGIWMKDMLINIDIYWLNKDDSDNFEPIHQVLNASPESYPKVFRPPTPVQYVLEIPIE